MIRTFMNPRPSSCHATMLTLRQIKNTYVRPRARSCGRNCLQRVRTGGSALMSIVQVPDEQLFRERGFAQRIGFGKRPALIVIDMLNAFTDPQMMLGADLTRQIEAINPILDAAHDRRVPVIFSMVMYDDP